MDGEEPEVVFFADAAAFRAWLEEHHETAPELWMERRLKAHPEQGLTWEDAVLEALCFGWIDSTSRSIGGVRAQRWSPRRPRSNWSAVNIAHVERLRAAGLMRPAGLAAFERRTPERTGVYAYENSDELTDAEASALTRDPAAAAFWEIATPGYRRICANWIHSAKREQTRTDRLATLVADCAAGRLIAPQRYGDTPAWVARAAEAARAATAD
ncbi:YdeI/OmpD-associated family protein [Microbacterium sp.]|uniref:YdeI/OmpD-associated family protein n=1 Tax=Microbacterium sp. TaxID=51671 RepID=UPI001AC9FFFB|nr:YdeI/OmpD-associated family protein [Microbacterium sp.]MBN9223890.1 YdeI/OmpD-associated family protein [Microbacterium sp.]